MRNEGTSNNKPAIPATLDSTYNSSDDNAFNNAPITMIVNIIELEIDYKKHFSIDSFFLKA